MYVHCMSQKKSVMLKIMLYPFTKFTSKFDEAQHAFIGINPSIKICISWEECLICNHEQGTVPIFN